jgi:hypothetical protein
MLETLFILLIGFAAGVVSTVFVQMLVLTYLTAGADADSVGAASGEDGHEFDTADRWPAGSGI